METLEGKQARITGLLKKRFEDPEKAKDELEAILGKGHRSIKELTEKQADVILEEFRREEMELKEKTIEGEIISKEELEEIKERSLPIPAEAPSGRLAIIGSDKALENLTTAMKRVHQFALNTLKDFPPKAFVIFNDAVCLRGGWIDTFLTCLPLPIAIKNKHELEEKKTPNGYHVYRFEADAENTLTGMSVPIYSEESSEKPFYCYRGKGKDRHKLPPDQVNLRDVRVAAQRGLRKEVVKCFFGLRSLTVEEAKEKGIKGVEKAFRVPFNIGEKE